MKKYLFLALIVVCAAGLMSWGVVGHKAVAQIAENHLTPKAKEAVKNLLGFESMADISSWADDIRYDQRYKNTSGRHFVNLPSGLTFDQFSAAIKSEAGENAYKVLLQCVSELQNSSRSKYDKVIALKFLVHIVGDAHQPMHVSHAEDRGGNNINVSMGKTFAGNLHGLWDSGFIEREGLSYKKMAVTYDTATPEEIKKWQSDSPMIWLWESYQISSVLYEEAAANPDFDDDYYKDHLPIVQKRIEKGGIRLAGLLNMIFDK